MKITRTYEVWTGGDMVEDFISSRDYAVKLAQEEVKRLKDEYGENTDIDVVVDEIVHYIIESDEDLEQLEREI